MPMLTPNDVASMLSISVTQARAIMRRLPHTDVGLAGQQCLRITPETLQIYIAGGYDREHPIPPRRTDRIIRPRHEWKPGERLIKYK